ncbi:MAG: 3-oxoacyl-[acyl-carrier-protein] reductase [Bacillota bacterium]|nr:3-oxoacyl-[acyl-carrier-protein] reductase [Bacillota bacterium]
MLLSGKTALITGASRGIGRAIALEFARQGCNIAINHYDLDEAAANEVYNEVTSMGREALLFKSDVSSFEQSKLMISETVSKWGRLDILVNNAGITRDALIISMKEEDFDRVMQVNLKGAFNMSKHAAGVMARQRQGRIINISSVVALIGNSGQANYCAAKAGIIGLTKSLARELASRSITVNAIAPGFIETDMTGNLPEDLKLELQKKIPLGRCGQPQDVAGIVCYLASDAGGYITGEVIRVDGGMGM